MTTTSNRQYQVHAPMIQLTGPHAANTVFSTGIETILRHGDILPPWVDQAEVQRLFDDGFITEFGA